MDDQNQPRLAPIADNRLALTLATAGLTGYRVTLRYLKGGHVHPLTAARIERAARDMGIVLPVRPEAVSK